MKLTFSLLAVVHGEDEVISESKTLEADTPQELASELTNLLREVAEEIDLTLDQWNSEES